MKRIVIVGAGITGLITAYLLNHASPETEITVIDAGPAPQDSNREAMGEGHYGATLGHSRDARHFTGSEGLSFQNPIHTRLLYEMAGPSSKGWLTIPEDSLSPREKAWRQECVDRYQRHVTAAHNPYDDMYAILNYGGMSAWEYLASINPEFNQFRLSQDYVYVAFNTQSELEADFAAESHFNPLNHNADHRVKRVDINVLTGGPDGWLASDFLAPQLLRLPGSTWQIKSLWSYAYQKLLGQPTVKFLWNSPIVQTASLPSADAYIWAAGSAYAIPELYRTHSRVQGIGGWWLTLANPGFKVPFKISAPQPSGYVNFTPSGDLLHISGGFGWTGERTYGEAIRLLQPIKEHLFDHVARYLKMPRSSLANYNAGCCIRPTTPTGMPDAQVFTRLNQKHIMISGAGKAGATEAPLLALYAVTELDVQPVITTAWNNPILQKGLALLSKGLEP